jgi:hypothetical protein
MVRDTYQYEAGLRNLTLPAELDLEESDIEEHWRSTGQGDFVLTRAPHSEAILDPDDVLMLMRHVWITSLKLVKDGPGGFGKSVRVKGADVFVSYRIHQNLWLEPRRTLTVSF